MWQYNNTYPSELYHWGIKGQKWGVIRFQNEDGTLTPAGRIRYADDEYSRSKTNAKSIYRNAVKSGQDKKSAKEAYQKSMQDARDARTIGRYQGEELQSINNKYRYDNRIENRQRNKLDKLREKGAKDKNIQKAEDRLIRTLSSKYFSETIKNIETSVVMKRTLSEINEENKTIGKAKAFDALTMVGAMATAAVGGFGVYQDRDVGKMKTNYRVNDEQKTYALANAMKRAREEVRNN